MSHYKSNLRDIHFNLFELFDRDQILGRGPFSDIDGDTSRDILAEVDRLAREDLAASFIDGDRNPPVFDPRTFTAPVPVSFRNSYQAWMDAEFWRLQIREELGGTLAPSSLNWALSEMVMGANPALLFYATGARFAQVVYNNGTERDRRVAQIMVERQWGCTMALTEDAAGSDVGAGRVKATPTPNGSGSWNITGVKRFITSGEHDMSENIMHLVLARPQGFEDVGGPGTKGLSLFWVPKYHFDHETGELTGERNGVYATNVERKMGLRVSNTCEVTFGAAQVGGGEPAVGWLLGEKHDGIAQMFQVIENARMLVGTKAIGTLSTGYLNALAYAKERVQGADMTESADRTARRVTITHHPDVRRSLMTQKSSAEAMRALVLYTATWQDRVAIAAHEGKPDLLAEAVNNLLLPIVKGYGSERSWVLLGTETLQTFGGSGFLNDYPIEQYLRDAKIDTLYEGTTAIQAQDLFFRKIVKDQGKALARLTRDIEDFIASEDGTDNLKFERSLLDTALADMKSMVRHMMNDLTSANPTTGGGDVRDIYKVGLNTTRLLMVLGDVVCSWLLLWQAEVALYKLAGGVSDDDRNFYEGKIAAAQFFAAINLPRVTAELAVAMATGLSVMEIGEAAF